MMQGLVCSESDILLDGDVTVRPIVDLGSVPFLQQITTVSSYLYISASRILLNVLFIVSVSIMG